VLDAFLDDARGQPGVWFPRCIDIADYLLAGPAA
jgi:hypothetical protein